MKISIFLEHLLQAHEQSGKSIEEVFSAAKKCGIDGIETNAGFIGSQEELQKKLQNAGLSVSQLYENYTWEDFDNDIKMKNHIATAKKLGADKILFIPPYFSDMKTETVQAEKEKVKIMIRKICALAKSVGITVTMEDFDNLQNPSSKLCFLEEYIKEIPELMITFDTGNFLANGEEVLEAYPVLESRIVNVHCKDRLPDVSSCPTGTGIIPFKIIVEKLKRINYNGNYSIEHFDIEKQLEAMDESARFVKTFAL
ncbi:MAG: sugar phosphate isomerase/epimerase [Treponema sp.]|nr:sugar phosphate isomerase/epimerase [Treponema sp.]